MRKSGDSKIPAKEDQTLKENSNLGSRDRRKNNAQISTSEQETQSAQPRFKRTVFFIKIQASDYN
jgi:hypothetical protein